MGFSDQLIPSDVKNQRLQPLCHPPGNGANQGPTQGVQRTRKTIFNYPEGDPLRAPGYPQQKGESECTENEKDTTIVESLIFFNLLCDLEQNLPNVFNKLNNTEYTSGVVNLSKYSLTNTEKNVLSKGLGFCSTPGAPDIGNLIPRSG